MVEQSRRRLGREQFISALDQFACRLRDSDGTASSGGSVLTGLEIQTVLGSPDLVVPGTEELHVEWRYGAAGRSRMPTLGSVGLDRFGNVVSIWGAGNRPPGPGLSERARRSVLALLAAVPAEPDLTAPWDPLVRIRAVNALQKLGPRQAWSMLDEFLRLTTETRPGRRTQHPPYGLATVVPFLYSTRRNEVLVSPTGGASLVRHADIPLLLRSDMPREPRKPCELDWDLWNAWRSGGRFLNQPLTPPDQPLLVVEDLQLASYWPRVSGAAETELLRETMEQIVRLVVAVYRPPQTVQLYGSARSPTLELARMWPDLARDFDRIRPRWNRHRQAYQASAA